MGTQEMPLWRLRAKELGCGTLSSSFRKWLERFFLGPQPIAAVGRWKALPLGTPSLCPNVMLCESMRAVAQGQVIYMEVENDPGASVGQGQARYGISCDNQDRQWETSIKLLFHTEELLVTLPVPWNCAPPPSLWIMWKWRKTNTVMSYWICMRHEAAALGSLMHLNGIITSWV